jgi:transcriptional regulator with XRE-family HTH domain
MTTLLNIAPLEGRDLAEYGAVRLRDQAFDAIKKLWERRCEEGITQKELAERIGMDTGRLSKVLRGPGNWTLRTIGALVQGLRGEIDFNVSAVEDGVETPANLDAYTGYRLVGESPIAFSGTTYIGGVSPSLEIGNGSDLYLIILPASGGMSFAVGGF